MDLTYAIYRGKNIVQSEKEKALGRPFMAFQNIKGTYERETFTKACSDSTGGNG